MSELLLAGMPPSSGMVRRLRTVPPPSLATVFSRVLSSEAASQMGTAGDLGESGGQPPSELQVWLVSRRMKLPPSSSPTNPPSASVRKRSLQLLLPLGLSEVLQGPPSGPQDRSAVLQPEANSLKSRKR